MKKVFFAAALCIIALGATSFTSVKAPGVSFHDEGTDNFTEALQVCNGNVVLFSFTVEYDVRGAVNQNRANVHGTNHFIATGTDPVTGEVYTLDTHDRFTENTPLFPDGNGAFVFRFTRNELITGDQGSSQHLVIKQHTTFNANGTQTATHFTVDSDCP